MTGFGGSSTGEYIFSKEKISAASLNEVNDPLSFSVFPNPVSGTTATLYFFSSADEAIELTIHDLNGKKLHSEILPNAKSMQQHILQTDQLEPIS